MANEILIGTYPYGDVFYLLTPDTTTGIEQITVIWEDIEWANSYNLYWSTTPGITDSTNATKIESVTSPYIHDNLIYGQTYYYVITAENEGGESDFSYEVNDVPYPQLPGIPQDVDTTAGIEEIIVSWNDSTGVVDSYNIYWDTTSEDLVNTGFKIEDVVSPYIHTNLIPGITYYYVITAENDSGESEVTELTYDIPIPLTPTGVDTTAGIEQITISWDPVEEATSYNIYWDTTSGELITTGTKIEDASSPYIHGSLSLGQTYYYVVTAVAIDTESDISLEVSDILDVASPENPNASCVGDREITITWDSVIGATQYNIYWLKTPGVTKATGNKIPALPHLPYTHIDLDPDGTYYYVITAENAISEGEISSEVSAIAVDIPDAPTGVDTAASFMSVIVSWDELPHIDSYNIYWDTTSGVTKDTGTLIEGVNSIYTHVTPSHLIPFYYVITAVNDIYESVESSEVNATPYIEPFNYPEQIRTIDSFSNNRFSSGLTGTIKMATLGEDLVIFPEHSFGMAIDSTHEITIGRGIFVKDNTLVHVQDTFTMDFSDNDYYLDSTGSMEEAGYYYIVIEYEYKRQRPSPKASYRIIRDVEALYDPDIHLFLGTVEIAFNGEYVVNNVYTYDPLDQTIKRPTIPSAASMSIDAGEL